MGTSNVKTPNKTQEAYQCLGCGSLYRFDPERCLVCNETVVIHHRPPSPAKGRGYDPRDPVPVEKAVEVDEYHGDGAGLHYYTGDYGQADCD